MPDRIVRDEILESDRWLDLPSDSHRLVYIALIMRADDYGNLEGGPRRLFRWMNRFTQVKTDADSIKLMSDLQDADMVLRYEVEGKEYWHVTRFKNSRWYWRRDCPQSPYPDDVTNEEKQRPSDNRNKRVIHTSATRREGVGVGVGVGVGKNKTPDGDPLFLEFWSRYPNKANKVAAFKAWTKLKPDASLREKMYEAILAQRETEQWRSGVIPHASTWLNNERWNDELVTANQKTDL